MHIRANQLKTGMWLFLLREKDLMSEPGLGDALRRHLEEYGRSIRIDEIAAITPDTVSISIGDDWMFTVAADRELWAANVYQMCVKHPDGTYHDAHITIDYAYDDRDEIVYSVKGIAQFTFSVSAISDGTVFATGAFPALDTFNLSNDRLHRHAATHIAGLADDPGADVIAEMLIRPTGITVADVRKYPSYLFDLHADRLHKTRCPHRYFLADSCPGCDADEDAEAA